MSSGSGRARFLDPREAAAGSDVDALLVLDPSLPLTRELYRRWDAASPGFEGRAIDAHFIHLSPASTDGPGAVWCEAAVEGHLWYDLAWRAGWPTSGARSPKAGRPRGRARTAVLERGRVMRNRELATDHLKRAAARLKALDVLFDSGSWADVLRESQEVVELSGWRRFPASFAATVSWRSTAQRT